ncbi:GNAT family N-acetyltransferase [Actinacidiphila soli]|uniref:hypothetical protein n=1 Tax=Actinacidiphila soli TaxID=2487275 RepID=UPI000FCC145F|nr:hypothetical protein [Actinacidiphila soli]
MEIRPATPADLDAMLAVHTAARTAYYRAGGLSEAELTDPAEHAGRAAGWARAVERADRTTLCAVRADGAVVVSCPWGRSRTPSCTRSRSTPPSPAGPASRPPGPPAPESRTGEACCGPPGAPPSRRLR